MNLQIVKLEKNDDDAKLVMNWRNDPITRKMSYSGSEKKWDSFKNVFYDNYFNHIIDSIFVTLDGIKIAFIGFQKYDDFEDTYSISINVDPEYRGRKLGSHIIKTSLEYVKINYPSVKQIFAEIKIVNHASLKVFKRSKFILYDRTIKNVNSTTINIERLIYIF